MKVFRFMSKKEFEDYKQGKILKNDFIQSNRGKTNSIGFCFLKLDDFEPEKAYHFLVGVTSMDICVVFEVDKNKLNKTWGEYAKPLPLETKVTWLDVFDLMLGNVKPERMKIDEYCTTQYDIKNFKLLKTATPSMEKEWKWKEYENG